MSEKLHFFVRRQNEEVTIVILFVYDIIVIAEPFLFPYADFYIFYRNVVKSIRVKIRKIPNLSNNLSFRRVLYITENVTCSWTF